MHMLLYTYVYMCNMNVYMYLHAYVNECVDALCMRIWHVEMYICMCMRM